MIRSAAGHARDCRRVRRLLKEHEAPNVGRLRWYDRPLAGAVRWRGMLSVLWWNLRGRQDDEIAGNYALRNLYYAPPSGDGLHESAATVWHCAGLSTGPWFDGELPACRALEAAAPAIIAEYWRVAERIGTHPDNASLTGRGRWTGMFLYQAGGRRNEELSRLCPETTRVVEGLPLCTNFGFVMFSGMEPRTHVAPHTGSTNLRLRCHLGVHVPEPGRARLRVGTEWRHWEQGRAFAFDDSYQHEVVHDGDRDRVVLVVDVWHPGLTPGDRAVLGDPVFQRFGKAPR